MYEAFYIRPTDDPYLVALKHTSYEQWVALMSTQLPNLRSYEAAAAELGWPLNTYKTRLHRARSKILKWRSEAEVKTNPAS